MSALQPWSGRPRVNVWLISFIQSNLGEMLMYAAEMKNVCLHIVSGRLRCLKRFGRTEVWVRTAGWDGFDHSWQLQLIRQQGNGTRVKGGRAWRRVCMCGCNLPEFPSCSRSCTNSPWISSQITLQYLPAQKTVCAFDCRLILQCSCSLAKGVGLTCYLGQRFSVFSISGTSRHLMRVFFFPAKWEMCQWKHMPHALKIKWNIKWIQTVVLLKESWVEKRVIFSPHLYFRDWMMNDQWRTKIDTEQFGNELHICILSFGRSKWQ